MKQTASLAIYFVIGVPLCAQAWDIRAEVPFAKGQNLPQTLLLSNGELASGSLDTGTGAILSVSHRIIRVGPVLKFEWGAEYTHWTADGKLQQGKAAQSSVLRQTGLGLGLNAQFWVPFTGVAGELGLIQRFQNYQYKTEDLAEDRRLSRTWLRAGLRWRIPMPLVSPYLAASYQLPLFKNHPVHMESVSDLPRYFDAQRSGQEFDGMWTFGAGVQF